jgi:uncharacterized protein YprB with RNaseH-like and TPR domain
MGMLRATFQLVPGLGQRRERRLWQARVLDWTQFSDGAPALGPALRAPLGEAIARAEVALAAGDLEALAAALPAREHWRLFGAFPDRALYLDIETGPEDEDGITAVGLLDQRGPRVLLAGRDLAELPEAIPRSCLLVTFNGGSFDLPVLERAFPGWRRPAAHVDLRTVLGWLGLHGGLKAIEEQTGIGRPARLRGLGGAAAAWLWRHGARGNREALRLFAEYNLYDTVNLRTLMALAHNRLAAAWGIPAAEVPVSYRGDVLYDISKILLAL